MLAQKQPKRSIDTTLVTDALLSSTCYLSSKLSWYI